MKLLAGAPVEPRMHIHTPSTDGTPGNLYFGSPTEAAGGRKEPIYTYSSSDEQHRMAIATHRLHCYVVSLGQGLGRGKVFGAEGFRSSGQ
jgi:hypothetical protein